MESQGCHIVKISTFVSMEAMSKKSKCLPAAKYVCYLEKKKILNQSAMHLIYMACTRHHSAVLVMSPPQLIVYLCDVLVSV